MQPSQARTGRLGRVRGAETIQLLLCSLVTHERTSPGVISLAGDGGIADAPARVSQRARWRSLNGSAPSVPPVGKMAQRLLGAPDNVRLPPCIVAPLARSDRNRTSVTLHTHWTLARPDGWATLRASPYGPGGNDRPWRVQLGTGRQSLRTHSLAGAVAPRGGGMGPGRVRTGRAGGAVEFVRPSRGPGEARRPRLARGGGRAAGRLPWPAGLFARVVRFESVRPCVRTVCDSACSGFKLGY